MEYLDTPPSTTTDDLSTALDAVVVDCRAGRHDQAWERISILGQKLVTAPVAARAQVIGHLAYVLHGRNVLHEARVRFQEAEVLWRVVPSGFLIPQRSFFANGYATLLCELGEHAQARPLLEMTRRMEQDAGLTWTRGHADTLLNLAWVLRRSNELSLALSCARQGVAILAGEQLQTDQRTLMRAKNRLAIIHQALGEYSLALDIYSTGVEAQRDACLAYITSQKAEGWMPVANRYDDPAFSGGTLNRPALQRLLVDIDAGRIDCVVTYKLDRLSRSLADFTRLMEVFERRNVTFVSITQSFNTTTSMGRLTLNILLSFAQFERETTADRIRDKYAASRQKGIWMGGCPPLGYDISNRELVVNPQEAEQVRHIFRRFAETGSPTQVIRDLRESGLRNKSWTTTGGIHREGQPIHKASLYRILKNRVYLGEAVYREVSYPGKHQPIVARELWDRVHGLIQEHNRPKSNLPRGQTPFPLKGLVRCGHCDLVMKPTHSRKSGQVQYRYYICLNAARTSHDQCPMPSVPAAELERLVLNRLRGILKSPQVVARAIRQVRKADPEMSEREIIEQLTSLDPIWEELFPLEQNRLLNLLVEKVVVTDNGMDLRLRVAGLGALVNELSSQQTRSLS